MRLRKEREEEFRRNQRTEPDHAGAGEGNVAERTSERE
jgi:hypothetical protein